MIFKTIGTIIQALGALGFVVFLIPLFQGRVSPVPLSAHIAGALFSIILMISGYYITRAKKRF